MASSDLTWLPEQDEEKLKLGFRIVENAFKGKVSSLENEIRALKAANEEKQHALTGCQKKNSALEVEIIETHQRAQQLSDENKTLLTTVKQLRKQIEKLDRLKKTFMDTMETYNTPGMEGGGDPARDDVFGLPATTYSGDEYLRGAAPLTMQAAAAEYGGPSSPGRGVARAKYPDRATPAHDGSSYGFGGASPPGSPQVDGKAFFRAARGKLSYPDFNTFLSHIKKLNNHQQTREQTLDEARKIFGPQNADLYGDFQALLNRHS